MSQLLHFSAEIEIARRIRRAIAILSPRSVVSKPSCQSVEAGSEDRTIRFSPVAAHAEATQQRACLDPERCGFGPCRGACRDLPPAA
jgi:hypothetical protein